MYAGYHPVHLVQSIADFEDEITTLSVGQQGDLASFDLSADICQRVDRGIGGKEGIDRHLVPSRRERKKEVGQSE